MSKNLHPEAEEGGEQSKKELAAAYSFLGKLSDTEFESFLTRETILPPEYEKEVQNYLSLPIQKRIAEWKHKALANTAQSSPVKVGLVKRLKDALCPFTILLPLKPAMAVEFCSDPNVEPPEQRTMNLREWFEEDELNERLPWASHTVVIMKSPIKNKPGMVRYRVMVEKREGSNDGALCITLQAGEHTDKVQLEPNQRSKTFLKTVLPTDTPVSFAPTLE